MKKMSEKKIIEILDNNNWEYLDYIDIEEDYNTLKKAIERYFRFI